MKGFDAGLKILCPLRTYRGYFYYDFKGTIHEEQANSATSQFYGSLNTEFLLPKDYKLQVNGYYYTPFYDAIQKYYPQGSISLAISKSFFKKKLDVTLGLSDILYSEKFRMTSTLSDQYYLYASQGDSRRVRISLSYKFGKIQIEQKLKVENNDNRFKK